MKKLMSNKDYHEHKAIGSTALKRIASQSVLHYLSSEVSKTPALILGSAVHTATLEPENFEDEFAIAPKVDRRTKAGKETWAQFLKESEGKETLTVEQMETIIGIKSSIASHPIASQMIIGGEGEHSYFVTDEETGLELKCRPDYMKNNALIDLKTCQDASPKGFARAMANLGYHIQAAYYLDVYNKANGTNLDEFYFLAVETTKPYAVAIYKVDEFAIEEGRGVYRKALRDLKFYLDSIEAGNINVHKFGYGDEIRNLELPNYAFTGA